MFIRLNVFVFQLFTVPYQQLQRTTCQRSLAYALRIRTWTSVDTITFLRHIDASVYQQSSRSDENRDIDDQGLRPHGMLSRIVVQRHMSVLEEGPMLISNHSA